MTMWFYKRYAPDGKIYKSRSVSIRFRPQHWKLIQWKDNGATRTDACYDLNIYFLGVFFSYSNYDHNAWMKNKEL